MPAGFDHDVIVVGGGAMGAATAWHLARDGRDVLLVEQFEPGHVHGSSHGHTRIFRVAYRDPRYTALALEALSWWRVLEDECGEPLLDQCGQIDHGTPAALAEVGAALGAHGRPFERLSRAAADERWPGIRTEAGAVLSPDGGFVAADRSVAALYRVATRHGAHVRTGERVDRIEPIEPIDSPGSRSGARVITDQQSWSAPVVVAAAGPWTAGLLDGVIGLPPLAVTLAVPSHFRPRADNGRPWPSVLHHVDAASPLTFGAYAVWAPGVGLKVGLEDAVRPVDPDTGSFDPPAAAVAALTEYVEAWFPGLDPVPLDPHTCLFTSTSDEHFVIDRQGPIVVVSPCSGHGFKFVPAIGRLAADLAESPRPDAPEVRRDAIWRLPSSGLPAS